MNHDAKSVAKLVRVPFRVNGTRSETIATPEDLLTHGKIFSEGVVAKVRKAEPRAIFCRNGSAMLGDGVIWAHRELGIALADVLNK